MTVTTSYGLGQIGFYFKANTDIGFVYRSDVTYLANGGYVVAHTIGNSTTATVLDFYSAPTGTNPGTLVAGNIIPYSGTTVSNFISQPVLTTLANGNVLVVWDEEESGNDRVLGTILSPTGAVVVSEFTINALGTAGRPAITALANGGFATTYDGGAVVWTSVFNASGVNQTQNSAGVYSQTNTASLTAGNGSPMDSATAGLAGGGYVIAWTDGAGSLVQTIRARLFNDNGSPRQATEITIATGAGAASASPVSVAGLPNGNWAVVWTDDNPRGVFVQIFDANGAAIAAPHAVPVNTLSTADLRDPDITVLDNGFLAISYSQGHTGSVDSSTYITVLDGVGNALPGLSFISAGYSGNSDDYTSITALKNATFATSWSGNADLGSTTTLSAITQINYVSRTTNGDTAANTIIGDSLKDLIFGDAGNDTLGGADGDDTIQGNAGNDIIDGGAGNNSLRGDSENDYIDGSAGTNSINGGSGWDTVVYDVADGLNVFGGANSTTNGVTDVDTLLLFNIAAPTSFNLVTQQFERAEGRFNDTGSNPWTSYINNYDAHGASPTRPA